MLVIVGHLELAPFLAGGQSRVIAFFALSGFLITAVLLKRYEAHGSISFSDFYLARLARFVPALLVVSVLGLVCATAAANEWWAAASVGSSELAAGLPRLWSQTLNFSLMNGATDLPYEFVPGWSLGIEWQFYLVWPVVVLGVLWAFGLRALCWLALAVAITGFSWSFWLALSVGIEEPRVMYGTDTRGAAILLGCAAAMFALRPAASVWLTRNASRIALIVGITLAVMFTQLFFDSGPHMTSWGQVVVASAVSLLAASLWVHPDAVSFLVLPWLAWLGQRSLGLFLFHVPVMQLFGGPGDAIRTLSVLAMTLALTAACYRWFEQPLARATKRWQKRRAAMSSRTGGRAAAVGPAA